MKKIENKLNNINKRIESIRENTFYCDNQYKINKLYERETDLLKRHVEEKYLNLRYEELEEELNTLLNLQEKYEQLLEEIKNF